MDNINWYSLVILPLIVFCARVMDVSLGTLIIRIILPYEGELLAERLREAGYGVTLVNGMGSGGEVKLIFTAIPRKNLGLVTEIIKSVSPRAFFSVEELRSTESGIFPATVTNSANIRFL